METLDSVVRIQKINESLKKDYLAELVVPAAGIQRAKFNLLKNQPGGLRPTSYDVQAYNAAGQQVTSLPQFTGRGRTPISANDLTRRMTAAGFNVQKLRARPSSFSDYQADLQKRLAGRRSQLGIQPRDFTQQQRDVALLTGNRNPIEMRKFRAQYNQYTKDRAAQMRRNVVKGALSGFKIGGGALGAAGVATLLAPIATAGLAPGAAILGAGYLGSRLVRSGVKDLTREREVVSVPGLNQAEQQRKANLVSTKALMGMNTRSGARQNASWASSVASDISSIRGAMIRKRLQDVASGRIIPGGMPIAGISPTSQILPSDYPGAATGEDSSSTRQSTSQLFQLPSIIGPAGQVRRQTQFKSALTDKYARVSPAVRATTYQMTQNRRLVAGYNALTDPRRIRRELMSSVGSETPTPGVSWIKSTPQSSVSRPSTATP